MKKETLFAILLGLAAGIGVAFFVVFKAHENQIHNAKPITTINLTPTIAVRNSQSQPLEITSPDTGFTTALKTVTIKGKAAKDSLLVVQSPIRQLVKKLDANSFTVADFPLALGENVIRISVYPKDSQATPEEKELRVYVIDE